MRGMTDRPRRAWVLPVLVAPFALWALSRLVAHDTALPLVWASSITPWGFLPAYLLLAVAIRRRRRWTAIAAGFAVACHVVWVAPSLVPTIGSADEGAPTVRVVTANLLGVNDQPDALLAELMDLDADVLVLEEVSPRWVHRLESPAARAAFPHRDVFVRPDSFGIAILSRLPLARSELVDLEGVPMIDATVTVGERSVRVIGVHTLPPVDSDYAATWRAQLARLADHVAGIDGPLVVAGDLNATTHAAGVLRLRALGLADAHDALGRGLATTWPNGLFILPPLRLDHVLVSPELRPVAVREGVGAGSDHQPVIVDLALTG